MLNFINFRLTFMTPQIKFICQIIQKCHNTYIYYNYALLSLTKIHY